MVVDEHDADAGQGSRSLAGEPLRAVERTPELRPYRDRDWPAVLEVCLRALAPACASLATLLKTELDWRDCVEAHLRSLTGPGERRRLVVAALRGSVIGFVHYEVDRAARSGSIGLSAVHPAWQGKGVGSAMYAHVLALLSQQGVECATAEAGGDASHAAARRAYEKAGFVAVPTVHYVKRLVAPAGGPGGRAGRRGRARPRPRPAGHRKAARPRR